MNQSNVLFWVGLTMGGALCLAVLCQLGLWIASSAQRVRDERRKRELEFELLEARVDAARRRRLASAEEAGAWEGYRKFEVAACEAEAQGIHSVYLEPHDKRPLPRFRPGQYLTFRLQVPDSDEPVVRCYSLSDTTDADRYRITVKKLGPPRDEPDAPPGRASSFFNDHVKAGDIIDVKAPQGSFYLDTTRERPVVLIGGGIGLTPMLSMLNTIAATGSPRETRLFFGVRNGSEHIFKGHLKQIEAERDNVQLHVCYSRPDDGDEEGRDYHEAGRVDIDLLKRTLPSNNYDFYICGPPPMMRDLVHGLEDWGVPESQVNYEAFGPASIKKATDTEAAGEAEAGQEAPAVTFARSDKTVPWSGAAESVLELAEGNGVDIDFGCRVGNCGTCLVAVKSGKVKYPKEPNFEVESGSCLTCICRPDGDLTLDA